MAVAATFVAEPPDDRVNDRGHQQQRREGKCVQPVVHLHLAFAQVETRNIPDRSLLVVLVVL